MQKEKTSPWLEIGIIIIPELTIDSCEILHNQATRFQEGILQLKNLEEIMPWKRTQSYEPFAAVAKTIFILKKNCKKNKCNSMHLL